ncbi:CorA family divalent cation transporter [Mahella australiensis]|uniref:CorA family divalent cation transporter n=1 Tax=Mahella australiensis TaxID=252966 RepID=UPI0011D2A02A|nr:CorA family divalent cation transporter [Mahella australiensis]
MKYRIFCFFSIDVFFSTLSDSSILHRLMLPTVIIGIYGMNFDIPEPKWHYGYLWALSLMAAVTIAMIIYIHIRHKHWL